MSRARRFDGSKISNLRRTPTGGVIAECAATRTGIFVYTDSNGKEVKEYRSPEEVFKAQSLATLKGAAVTERHPPVMVNPDNWSKYNRGNVVEDSIKRGPDDHVLLDLAVNDAGTIGRIDSGELCEASCGYDCDIDNTPGVTPTGEAYDRAQRNIVYNHVALGPKDWARGGNTVCLRLDSNGDQCLNVSTAPKSLARKLPMIRLPKIERLKGHVLRVDGVDYRLKTAEGRKQAEAAIKSANDRIKADRADSLESRKDEGEGADFAKIVDALMAVIVMLHQAAAQAGAQQEAIETPAEGGADVVTADAEGAVVKGEPDGDEAKRDADAEADKTAKMDAAVARRAEIITKATAMVPGFKSTRADGKSKGDAEIMREALTVAKFDHKGLTDGELRGAFAVIKPHTTHKTLEALAGATGSNGRTDGGGAVKPSAAYKSRLASAWQPKK